MNVIIIYVISIASLLVFSYIKYRIIQKEKAEDKNEVRNRKSLNKQTKASFFKSTVLYDILIQIIVVVFGAFLAMQLDAKVEKQSSLEKAESYSSMLSHQCADRIIQIYNHLGTQAKDDEDYLSPQEAMDSMIDYILDQDLDSEKTFLYNDYMSTSLTSMTYLQLNMYYGSMSDECRTLSDISQSEDDYFTNNKKELVESIASYCYDSAVLSYFYEILKTDGADAEILNREFSEYSFWENTNGQKVYSYLIDYLESKFEIDLSEFKDKSPTIIESDSSSTDSMVD